MIEKFDSFDKVNENIEPRTDLPYKKEYPFICEYKDETMKQERGQCYVIMINFKEKTLETSNGKFHFYPNFDDVIIKRFVLSTKNETIYKEVNFQ
jgi:hypothetical protein